MAERFEAMRQSETTGRCNVARHWAANAVVLALAVWACVWNQDLPRRPLVPVAVAMSLQGAELAGESAVTFSRLLGIDAVSQGTQLTFSDEEGRMRAFFFGEIAWGLRDTPPFS